MLVQAEPQDFSLPNASVTRRFQTLIYIPFRSLNEMKEIAGAGNFAFTVTGDVPRAKAKAARIGITKFSSVEAALREAAKFQLRRLLVL